MAESKLFDITFELFQKLTILKKEEVLQLAIEHLIKKQQDLYPVLTCVRNYVRIKQLFNTLRDMNVALYTIVVKFSQIYINHQYITLNSTASIYAIEKLSIGLFDLLENILDTIVLQNKLHDHTSLNTMYQVAEKLDDIQHKLRRNYATTNYITTHH